MENLKAKIKEEGSRLTSQRLFILDYLKGVTCHPTAEIIHREVRKKLPRISLGTVYRNLEYLRDKGLVLEISSVSDKCHYDGNASYHLHFICKKCQTIYDIFEKRKNINLKEIECAGEIQKIECNIYGVCKKCHKTQKTKKK